LILNPFKYYSKRYKERKLNSKQLAKMMNRWPPSIANRIKVINVSEDFLKAKMVITRSWLNSAFDKIMFGGAIYSGMDMYYGMALPLILSI
jgi:acyl-coenzyme A thioesterase PaaI-like protein